MIHRTWFVLMPVSEGGNVSLDIAPEAWPGTQDNPIDAGNSPAGWNGAAGGSYYEIRGRPVRFATGYAGDDGFVPLLNLGWSLSVVRYNDTTDTTVPTVVFSESFQASLNVTPTADPSYGPVIQLTGPAASLGAVPLLVTLQIMQAKDEDRSNTGP